MDPRQPATDFNAVFVHLLSPGRTPYLGLLPLHAEDRDKLIAHWSHVTGIRSGITATVPRPIAGTRMR